MRVYIQAKDGMSQDYDHFNAYCGFKEMGFLIYNYFLAGNEFEDGVEYDLELLNAPNSKEYFDMFSDDIQIHSFEFGENENYMSYDFCYKNHVFVKIPTKLVYVVV